MSTDNVLGTMRENGAPRLKSSNLRFQIVTDVEQFFALKTAWDSLCARSGDYNFSQSFQWCSAAWTILGYPQKRKLYCLVGWLDNRVVLIWPFLIFRRGFWSILHPLGSVTTEYSDVLVDDNPDADHWVELAWQQVRATCNSDVIDLPFVRIDSRLHRVIAKERPMVAWGNSVSSVKWDGYQSWENYYQARNREFRYSLRTTRRRLSQHGNLLFEVVTSREQIESTINWIFLHKSEWLIRTKQDSPWQDAPSYKRSLIKLAAERQELEGVMLFVLKLDERIIGAVLCRISRHSAEGVISAFDRSYRQYGPGQLLWEDILTWAFKRRLNFDFRLGNDTYKKRWTNQESQVVNYRFVNSIWGAAFSLASRCRSELKALRSRWHG